MTGLFSSTGPVPQALHRLWQSGQSTILVELFWGGSAVAKGSLQHPRPATLLCTSVSHRVYGQKLDDGSLGHLPSSCSSPGHSAHRHKTNGGSTAAEPSKWTPQRLTKWVDCTNGWSIPQRRTMPSTASYGTAAATVARDAAKAVDSGASEVCIQDDGKPGSSRPSNGNGYLRAKETATQRAMRTPTFQVTEFTTQRGVASTPLKAQTAEQLGLAVRDISLFASDHRLTQQRATIAVRDGQVLFKTEAAKAIISASKAILFRCRRDTDTARLTESLLFSLEDPATKNTLPFELCVLEVLLYETVQYFEKKTSILHRMLEYLTSDITTSQGPFPTADHAQQLVPIQKLLVAIRADVKETSQAITELMENHQTLASICLTERESGVPIHCGVPKSACPRPAFHAAEDDEDGQFPDATWADEDCRDAGLRAAVTNVELIPGERRDTPHMRMATNILETYERQVESLQSFLAEMEENLENARETWHMQLDSARNHIIYTTLWLSMLNISVMLATVLPSAFGMNLRSGLPEESPYAFWLVSGVSVIIAIVSYPLFNRWYMREWSGQASLVTSTVKDLRTILLDHLDDIDDILGACRELTNNEGKISRTTFTKAVQRAMKGRNMSREASDLLWRFFDTNKDGFIEQAELVRAVEHRHPESPGVTLPEDQLWTEYRPRSSPKPNTSQWH